ncbi:MAG TPA: SDR family oxidoreductase [Acidimicrobiales bacterium]|nr:SDR family oxidoreductase [Acidimicrobiales bacterium]
MGVPTAGPFDLSGTVAVVTGGTRGVGLGIAREFLAAGASVVTCSRQALDEVPAAAGLGPEASARARHVRCDHRDADEVADAVAATLEAFGRLDVLVNNAGGSPTADAADSSGRFFASVLALNLVGPFVFSRAANEVMQRQVGGGVIVNISSLIVLTTAPGLAAYGAAKAGLNHLTRTLAVEWGPKVRVVGLGLGSMSTDSFEEYLSRQPPAARQTLVDGVGLGRLGTPAEIGRACIMVASDGCPFINGETVYADGGSRLGAPLSSP